MFNNSIWNFVKFGGQTSKNVQDVLKLALETFKCVFMGPSLIGRFSCIIFGLKSCVRYKSR